jgi:predicted dienelactone hydrolase
MKQTATFTLAVLLSLSAAAQRPDRPDPGALGPYAIGHTSFAVVDTNPDPTSPQVRGTRPIGVNVWYPVDASDVVGKTPDGLYPFDPIYSVRQPPPTSPNWIAINSDFEFPCDNLPAPPIGSPDPRPLCESRATHFPPTYEGLIPSAQGPFPLVLFSPGWTFATVVNALLAERIASHGFVVAVVAHYLDGYVSWDCLVGNDPDRPATTCSADPFYQAMYNRPRDVSFILDALLAKDDEIGNLLHNRMRPDLVAAAGHSLGGYTTLTLASGDDAVCVGTTFDTNPQPTPCNAIQDQGGSPIPTLPDPRIRAIVTLDAGNPLLYFSELARIAVPSLSIGESVEAPGWTAFFPARQHAAMSGDPKYRVDVVGAVHNSFTNSCTGGAVRYRHGWSFTATQLNNLWTNVPHCVAATPQADVARLAAQYTIAFLKTHLVGESGYQHILTRGWALTNEPAIRFFVTEPTSDDPATFLYFPYQRGGGLWEDFKEPPFDGPPQ